MPLRCSPQLRQMPCGRSHSGPSTSMRAVCMCGAKVSMRAIVVVLLQVGNEPALKRLKLVPGKDGDMVAGRDAEGPHLCLDHASLVSLVCGPGINDNAFVEGIVDGSRVGEDVLSRGNV